MTEQELAEIEARAAVATEGPWLIETDSFGDRHLKSPAVAGSMMCDTQYYPWTPDMQEDWVFIAHARTDVPALVAEVRRLRALIQQAEWFGPVIDQRATCPWCLTRGYHADNCPAFGR